MPAPTCSEDEFIAMFLKHGPAGMAKRLEIDVRGVYFRRNRIEKRRGIVLNAPNATRKSVEKARFEQRYRLKIRTGTVLVGSDAHIWPGRVPTAMRGFIQAVKELKPDAIVLNGDVCDFGSISRHAKIGWESMPTVADELEAAKERLKEIREAAPRGCKLVWPLGNHDARFETVIANRAPELAAVEGVHLSDHFPHWEKCWACWINDDVVIKHRYKGGLHASHNNTLWTGRTTITGHTHRLNVRPFGDYNGVRFGVECGTLGEVYGDHTADYTEDAPANQQAGYVVLTFHEDELLWPELAHVRDEHNGLMEFRGKVFEV